MAFTFDTLGYSKRLLKAGMARELAEAQAEAARDFIVNEIVTKADLTEAMDKLSLRLTVRLGSILGGMIVAATTLLALLIQF